MICALAGGVGGAKLAWGLNQASAALTVVVNTADDFVLYGLNVSPDLDTVMYTLAGLANPETGWGVVGDTGQAMEMVRRYGEPPWFHLGDRDLGTHLLRTQWLKSGMSLTEVTRRLCEGLQVRARVLPMTDAPVATKVTTDDGEIDFQDFFVRRHHQDTVRSVRFEGAPSLTDAVRAALQEARATVFCPSNPLVSIGPILAVPGLRDALPRPRIGVSPIVGGKALRGPADHMLVSLGHEASALGVARMYQGLLDAWVIDKADEALTSQIEALGMRVLVTDTVMKNNADRARLAQDVLDFIGEPALS
ncbi:MAG: 2-phospho-L-lactate transferase [Candidatus Xenobia bacterium]